MRARKLLVPLVGLSAIVTAAAATEVRGIVRVGGRPEPNAVVWLEAPNAPEAGEQPRLVLDQRNISFYPHVLAVRVGWTVEFPNNDRVFHNVFSFRDGKRFDLGLYPIGAVKRVTFDHAGLSRLFCNIHPHMAAYVMAVDSPFFGVSDETGAFTLQGVPEGTYTYHAWRPGGSILNGTVTIRAGKLFEVKWP